MKLNARIIRAFIALILVICTMFSLTSCLIDLEALGEIILGDIPELDGEFDNQDPGNDSGNGGATPILPDVPTGEFYPGSGEVEDAEIPALQKTLLSTVIVIADFTLSPSAGSGVIYKLDKSTGDAYIITNYHVIYNETYGVSKDISIYLYGMELSGYKVAATFVGGSINYDIAVLKVNGSEVLKNSYAREAVFGNSDNVRVFDTVYAVGNPEGIGLSANRGIVSVESEHLDIEGADGSAISLRVMRIDAAVNAGNSGGGLYDTEGRLVGIVSAKLVGANVDNVGYAIPSTLVKNLTDNIIYHCNGSSMTKLNRALMGITISAYVTGVVVDPETGFVSRAELVEVVDVSSGSLADGKVKIGDIVTAITVDGVTVNVTRMHHVTDHMITARVGSSVTLAIKRGEENITVNFTITADRITLEK